MEAKTESSNIKSLYKCAVAVSTVYLVLYHGLVLVTYMHIHLSMNWIYLSANIINIEIYTLI